MRPADRGAAAPRARGRGHGARLRPDARAVRALRDRARGDRPPPRRPARRPRRSGCFDRSCALTRWAKGRGFDMALGHGSNDITRRGPAPRHPERDDLRLRVRARPAQRQLPAGAGGRRARRDPARAPRALRGTREDPRATRDSRRSTTWRTSSPTTRVLRELGLEPRATALHRAHAARRVALSPLREPAVRPGARAPARREARSSCCRARAEQRAELRASSCPSAPWTRRRWSRARTSSSPPAGR